jgi:hypothetical protein
MSDRHLDPLELDAARAGAPDPHVERCAECRAAVEGLRELAARLTPPRLEVPAPVRRRILRSRGRRGLPFAAAAACLIGLASLWFARTGEPGDIDRSGSIDILDAYVLARNLRRAEVPDPRWDVTGDGAVDARDVEAIARRSVLLPGGSGR